MGSITVCPVNIFPPPTELLVCYQPHRLEVMPGQKSIYVTFLVTTGSSSPAGKPVAWTVHRSQVREYTGHRSESTQVTGQREYRSESKQQVDLHQLAHPQHGLYRGQRSDYRDQRSESTEVRGQRAQRSEVRKYIGRGQNVIHWQIFTSRHTCSMDWYTGQSSESRFS
jgi:hypothetical protein